VVARAPFAAEAGEDAAPVAGNATEEPGSELPEGVLWLEPEPEAEDPESGTEVTPSEDEPVDPGVPGLLVEATWEDPEPDVPLTVNGAEKTLGSVKSSWFSPT
jgi:hypothetical protein